MPYLVYFTWTDGGYIRHGTYPMEKNIRYLISVQEDLDSAKKSVEEARNMLIAENAKRRAAKEPAKEGRIEFKYVPSGVNLLNGSSAWLDELEDA